MNASMTPTQFPFEPMFSNLTLFIEEIYNILFVEIMKILLTSPEYYITCHEVLIKMHHNELLNFKSLFYQDAISKCIHFPSKTTFEELNKHVLDYPKSVDKVDCILKDCDKFLEELYSWIFKLEQPLYMHNLPLKPSNIQLIDNILSYFTMYVEGQKWNYENDKMNIYEKKLDDYLTRITSLYPFKKTIGEHYFYRHSTTPTAYEHLNLSIINDDANLSILKSFRSYLLTFMEYIIPIVKDVQKQIEKPVSEKISKPSNNNSHLNLPKELLDLLTPDQITALEKIQNPVTPMIPIPIESKNTTPPHLRHLLIPPPLVTLKPTEYPYTEGSATQQLKNMAMTSIQSSDSDESYKHFNEVHDFKNNHTYQPGRGENMASFPLSNDPKPVEKSASSTPSNQAYQPGRGENIKAYPLPNVPISSPSVENKSVADNDYLLPKVIKVPSYHITRSNRFGSTSWTSPSGTLILSSSSPNPVKVPEPSPPKSYCVSCSEDYTTSDMPNVPLRASESFSEDYMPNSSTSATSTTPLLMQSKEVYPIPLRASEPPTPQKTPSPVSIETPDKPMLAEITPATADTCNIF